MPNFPLFSIPCSEGRKKYFKGQMQPVDHDWNSNESGKFNNKAQSFIGFVEYLVTIFDMVKSMI